MPAAKRSCTPIPRCKIHNKERVDVSPCTTETSSGELIFRSISPSRSLSTKSPLSFTRALGISIPLCSPCNMIYAPSEREKSARGTRSEKCVFPRSYAHPSISEGEEGGKRDVRGILRRRRCDDE
jgi:hypothetical protein